MRYEWNDEIYDSIDNVLDAVISDDYHEDDEYFEEWVNDNYDGTSIYGEWFSAYRIVYNCNESLYGDLLSNYEEEMNDEDRDNARYELENSGPGETVYCQGECIRVIAEDEEQTDNDDDNDDEIKRRVCANLDEVRQFINDQKYLEQQAAERSKQEEDDVLELFQVVG